MFLKHLEPIFKPWRAMRNKVMRVKTVRGNVMSEGRRVQRFGRLAQRQKDQVTQAVGARAQDGAGAASANAGPVMVAPQGMPPVQKPQQMQAMVGGPRPGFAAPPPPFPNQVPYPGAPMSLEGQHPGHAAGPVPNPPIKIKGFWFWKRKICTQCHVRLDKTWDCCPYCAKNFAPKPPPRPMFAGLELAAPTPDGQFLLGWLVALNGPQRGELYTLSPKTVIGSDRNCTIVMHNGFLSGRHAEVVARNGVWVITDLGSTNGTKVNDKAVSQHELIDNDFISFGEQMLRFKCMYAAPPAPINTF